MNAVALVVVGMEANCTDLDKPSQPLMAVITGETQYQSGCLQSLLVLYAYQPYCSTCSTGGRTLCTKKTCKIPSKYNVYIPTCTHTPTHIVYYILFMYVCRCVCTCGYVNIAGIYLLYVCMHVHVVIVGMDVSFMQCTYIIVCIYIVACTLQI